MSSVYGGIDSGPDPRQLRQQLNLNGQLATVQARCLLIPFLASEWYCSSSFWCFVAAVHLVMAQADILWMPACFVRQLQICSHLVPTHVPWNPNMSLTKCACSGANVAGKFAVHMCQAGGRASVSQHDLPCITSLHHCIPLLLRRLHLLIGSW